MKHSVTTLGAAIAATLAVAETQAATVNLTLRVAASWSGGGSSAGNISSTTATWDYDTVTGLLTQADGVFNVRYTIAPTTTLFRHTTTGMLLGAPAATATTFSCIEGNFGGTVVASLCGNYNFGANFVNESTVSWGPGTAVSRTIGGDDMAFGPMQSVSQYDGFTTVSWDGTVLRMSNASCNPSAPGNANGCSTTSGANAGYTWTLSTPVPAAVWLFGSAVGLLGLARRRRDA
jgi:hypothetical protein